MARSRSTCGPSRSTMSLLPPTASSIHIAVARQTWKPTRALHKTASRRVGHNLRRCHTCNQEQQPSGGLFLSAGPESLVCPYLGRPCLPRGLETTSTRLNWKAPDQRFALCLLPCPANLGRPQTCENILHSTRQPTERLGDTMGVCASRCLSL